MVTMKEVTVKSLTDFPFDLVVIVGPHSDDSCVGPGGLVVKLGQFRPDVVIYVVVVTPGFNGVTNRWLHEHYSEARTCLQHLLAYPLAPDADAQDADQELLEAFTRREPGTDLRAYGEDPEEQLTNLLKTAIRWNEGRREFQELRSDSHANLRYYRFLRLVKAYKYKRLFSDEIGRFSELLSEIARTSSSRRLLLTPHPDDTHEAHRLSTECCLRSLGASAWDVWHYQTPSFDLPEISVVVPLNDREIGAKVDATKQHSSQIDRTKYDSLVRAIAAKNAQCLPEIIGGFGVDSQSMHFGEWCEVFQIREFCGNHIGADDITVFDAQFATDLEVVAPRVSKDRVPIGVLTRPR